MIKLSKDVETRLIDSVRQFYDAYMESDVGQLKAKLLLDFCLKEIGPSIYNQAIADAQTIMHEKVDDLDGSCYQEEFNFWKK